MTHEELRDAAYAIIRGLPTTLAEEEEALDHVEIVVNPRLRSSLGWAQKCTAAIDEDPDLPWYRIELNPIVGNDRAVLEDVVRHEAAHVARGPGRGHDDEWREVAVRFGASPGRMYPLPVPGAVHRREHRHDVECPGCGKRFTVTTRRARAIARDPSIWRHSRCGHLGLKIISESITKVQE